MHSPKDSKKNIFAVSLNLLKFEIRTKFVVQTAKIEKIGDYCLIVKQ